MRKSSKICTLKFPPQERKNDITKTKPQNLYFDVPMVKKIWKNKNLFYTNDRKLTNKQLDTPASNIFRR